MDIDITSTQDPTAGEPTTVVTLSGRFDAHEVPGFNEALAPTLSPTQPGGQPGVAVGLGDVVFVDSAALAALVAVSKQLRAAGGHFWLVNPSDPVVVILELTGLDQAFTVVDSVPAG